MMGQRIHPVFAGIDLLGAWQRLRAQQPALRLREGAAQLNVSEAELLYASLGRGVRRLRSDWQALLYAVPALGKVMALTRNEHCIHERCGGYGNIAVDGSGRTALVMNDEIDLRLRLCQWASLFAVTEELSDARVRHSLQIFDLQGRAVHKIYLTETSNTPAWLDLCAELQEDSMEPLTIAPAAAREAELADAQVQQAVLRKDWAQLQDSDDFMALLARHRVKTIQALRLAGAQWAQRVPVSALAPALERAASAALGITLEVGNHACLQPYTGPVQRLQRLGEWFNVLDPGFSLHLRESAIEQLWRVRKPSADGMLSSLQAYDAQGDLIMQVTDARKPSQPEDAVWREQVDALSAI
ncbi:MAG: ChuX/HutX family heme-like substrate-binding protein [Halopseudomonas sp.]|uniref:hemin-degrading factor n=1 Tax=Halopseudomonas sp. TaxID=2901191 RepID=UPI0030021B0B